MMLANALEVLYNNLPVREDSAAWYFSQAMLRDILLFNKFATLPSGKSTNFLTKESLRKPFLK